MIENAEYNQDSYMRKEVKTPVLEEIYTQRLMYEQHRKKLTQIRAQRKSHLGFDSNRLQQFQSIKQSKNKTFINRFNKANQSIATQNLKILMKLQTVKPSLNRSVSEERQKSSSSLVTPFSKSKIQETQKENMRICNKMKNMSSSLNQKKLLKDYAKSQQIKNRLMKYAVDETKVYLKSQRYLTESDNKSVSQKPLKKPLFDKSIRKSTASHYKREEIMKNKVNEKPQKKFRPNTSCDLGQQEDENFFTTAPQKPKPLKRRVYL